MSADDDELRSLRDLPVWQPPPQGDRLAREAFNTQFAPWPMRTLGIVSRAMVPVALAGVIGIYLSWAFSAALALQN